MKKAFVVVVLLALVAAAAARQSVYWALWKLSDALDQGDVATVEEHADLAAIAKAPAHLAAAMAEEVGRTAGGALAGAIASAVVSVVGGELASQNVDELKRSIARGDFAKGVGPFRYEGGSFPRVAPVQAFARTALVDVHGTCEGAPAVITFVFERREDGPVLGYPSTWRAVGVERKSLVELAKSCAAGARASHGTTNPRP